MKQLKGRKYSLCSKIALLTQFLAASLLLSGCLFGSVSSSGVGFESIFGVKRSELRNIKEYVDPDCFLEGSWVGHARFEGRAGITPSNVSDYLPLSDSEFDRKEAQFIVQDFLDYYPEDAAVLGSKKLRIYTSTNSSGTTRDFVVDPQSNTYFYQWQKAESKGSSRYGTAAKHERWDLYFGGKVRKQ